MLRLTVWMNMPSVYQDDFLEVLAAASEVDLRVIFAKGLTADRVQLGWSENARDYPSRFLSKRFSLLDAARTAWREQDRLHIVNGIWAEPALAAALCVLGLSRSDFVIHAEAPEPTIFRSAIKRATRSVFGRWAARRALGILAISHFAIDCYTRLGFRSEQVYSFGYFRGANLTANLAETSREKSQTEVIFVGQLVYRKGVDLLFAAMRPLFAESPDLRLTLIGAGEAEATLRQQAISLGIQDRVKFEGALSADRIHERLRASQVLVLPSRWDGWGIVINEAFSVGLPVIASSQCGASDLIQPGVNGYIFRSEDAGDLCDCLRRFLDQRDGWTALRAAAQRTAQAISVEAAVAYLIECLQHMTGASNHRPVPPWTQLALSPSTDR